jgi:hypothetical protein
VFTTALYRPQWPRGLKRRTWSPECWDCELESRLRHRCLSSSIHHHHHSRVTLSETLYSQVTVKAS